MFAAFDFCFCRSFTDTNVTYFNQHSASEQDPERGLFCGSMNKQWTDAVVDYRH